MNFSLQYSLKKQYEEREQKNVYLDSSSSSAILMALDFSGAFVHILCMIFSDFREC
jgi:hypothetical protein